MAETISVGSTLSPRWVLGIPHGLYILCPVGGPGVAKQGELSRTQNDNRNSSLQHSPCSILTSRSLQVLKLWDYGLEKSRMKSKFGGNIVRLYRKKRCSFPLYIVPYPPILPVNAVSRKCPSPPWKLARILRKD